MKLILLFTLPLWLFLLLCARGQSVVTDADTAVITDADTAIVINEYPYLYTGPGGVGDSSTNRLWLRADDLLFLNDGDPVSSWTDTSGNNFDATQIGTERPVLVKDTINGLPGVYFDGIDDVFRDIFSISNRDMTIYTVFAHDHTGSSSPTGPLWSCLNNDYPTGFFPMYFNGDYFLRYGNNSLSNTSNYNNKSFYVNYVLRGFNKTELFDNGYKVDSININTIDYNYFSIACRPSNNQYYRGFIAELIFYDYDLNDAQQIIVNNYLAAKYNMTIANDYYAFDSLHGYEMAGIGRKNFFNKHEKAQSGKILTVGYPNSMGSNEYLMFAHDGSDITSWYYDAELSYYRLTRFWMFDETGEVGDVRISISNELLPAKEAGYNEYKLLIYREGNITEYNNQSYINISDGDSLTIGLK